MAYEQEFHQHEQHTLLEEKIKEPLFYRVILYNDDYTTMEFVVSVLVEIFRKSINDAQQIMFTVHTQQKAVCGIYVKEIAEVRVERTLLRAKEAGYPLLCTYEPDESDSGNDKRGNI